MESAIPRVHGEDQDRLKGDKDLSFGERKMLDTARTLLVQELALAKGVENSDVVRELDTMFPLQ